MHVLRTCGGSGNLRGVTRTLAASALLAFLALLTPEADEPTMSPAEGHTLAQAHVELAVSQASERTSCIAAAVLRRLGARELLPRAVIGIARQTGAKRAVGTARSKWRRLARMGLDGDADH